MSLITNVGEDTIKNVFHLTSSVVGVGIVGSNRACVSHKEVNLRRRHQDYKIKLILDPIDFLHVYTHVVNVGLYIAVEKRKTVPY